MSVSNKPVVFFTYSEEDTPVADAVARSLREDESFAVDSVVFDLSEDNVLKLHFLAERNPMKILVVALSRGSTEPSDRLAFKMASTMIPNDLIAQHRTEIKRIFILALDTYASSELSTHHFVPATYADAEVIPFFPDPAADPQVAEKFLELGVQKLQAKLRQEFNARAPAQPKVEESRKRPRRLLSMSGIIEAGETELEMLSELHVQVQSRPAVDQKFLYWGPYAAARWQRIVNSSLYPTAQMSMNLIVSRKEEIIGDICKDVRGKAITFINLGVGLGTKDYHILSELVKKFSQVSYVAVDDSSAMLTLTLNELNKASVADLVNQGQVSLGYILGDFESLPEAAIQEYLKDHTRGPRLIGFLGSAIGNFSERYILRIIKSIMRPEDVLLLGVEYVAGRYVVGREEEFLTTNYSDSVVQDFEGGPVIDAFDYTPSRHDYVYRLVHSTTGNGFTDVPGAVTIVGEVNLPEWIRPTDLPLRLFASTKYEPKELEKYLRDVQKFDILGTYPSFEAPPRYGKYLLRLHQGR